MRHLLALPKASIFEISPWRVFARSVASEPAEHCNEGSDKNGTLGQRWQQHENQALIAGIKNQQLQLEKAGRWNAEQSSKERWEEIEFFCYSKGINRTAEQCRDRWKRLLRAFYKIKSWESSMTPGRVSFWAMKVSDKKLLGLPFSLDRNTFNAIDAIQNKKETWHTSDASSCMEGDSSKNVSSSVKSLKLQNQSSDVKSHALETKQHMQAQQKLENGNFETHHQQETDCEQLLTDETLPSISSDVSLQALKDKSNAVVGESTQKMNTSESDNRSPLLVKFIHQSIADLGGIEYDPGNPFKAQPGNNRGTSNKSNGSTED